MIIEIDDAGILTAIDSKSIYVRQVNYFYICRNISLEVRYVWHQMYVWCR